MSEEKASSAQWRVEHWNYGEGLVRATAKGPLDLVLVIQKAVEALEEARQHSSQKFLIDDREATLALDTLQLYELPKTLERIGLSKCARVAVVYTVTSPSAQDFQFFETVALNQGYEVKLFTSIDQPCAGLRRRATEACRGSYQIAPWNLAGCTERLTGIRI